MSLFNNHPTRFWDHADLLVASSEIVIDRPRGPSHPHNSVYGYPIDHGHLAGTTGSDGDGIDIWRGSLTDIRVTAVIITVDILKRDTEFKLLVGCTASEMRFILSTHQSDSQATKLIRRADPATNGDD